MAQPEQAPPAICVCRRIGTSFATLLEARITLLHELAHLWHWQLGVGDGWPDLRTAVGTSAGIVPAPIGVPMEEQVATAVSWGLLDQLRRPVGSELPCERLYEQYVALTGRAPLGPMEPVCRPDSSTLVDGGP